MPTRALAAALTLLALGAAPAAAQDCAAPRLETADGCLGRAEVAAGARRIAAAAQDELGLTASILRVSVDGAAILTEAWGETVTGVPAAPDMRFRNGAIAIAYMAVAALRLAEAGVIDLDAPIAPHAPGLPDADRITPAMLIANTSGYRDYVGALPLYENPFRDWSPDELLELAFAQGFACDPGACFTYAHTNYVALGRVLEAASGRPMAELIAELVVEPLGLRNTTSAQTARIEPPVLHGYTAERGTFEASTDWSPSWTLAEGAVMTTDIYDAERSAVGIGSGALLSPEDQARLTAPLPDALGRGPTGAYYAFGVVMDNGWILQTPSFHGYFGVMAYHPASRIAVAYAATAGPRTPDRPNAELLGRLGAWLTPATPPMGRRAAEP